MRGKQQTIYKTVKTDFFDKTTDGNSKNWFGLNYL